LHWMMPFLFILPQNYNIFVATPKVFNLFQK